MRYERDGKGVREITVRLRIQSDSAVHQFGLLRFKYSSSFESVAVEYVRVRKPDGTLVPTPASDMQDLDSEVSREAPMYTDTREKHIAVKTLAAGDVLEYQITWTVHDAVAPGHFWLDDNPAKDAICLDEQVEFDLPKDLPVKFSSSWVTPQITESGDRKIYSLHGSNLEHVVEDNEGQWEKGVGRTPPPAVRLSSFQSWAEVGKWFADLEAPQAKITPAIQAKADELTKGQSSQAEKIKVLYTFVSQNFRYIGVSLGQGRYTPHRAEEVLANRYGDCKDKHTLFQALLAAEGIKAYPALISSGFLVDPGIPSPDLFDHLITAIPDGESFQFVDTTPETGSFGYLLPVLREKTALVMADGQPARLVKTPATVSASNFEKFHMDAVLDAQGTLDGKGKIESTGDSELALRSAFRAIPENRWTELVQALSGRMGFGGTVSEVAAAQPQATGEAFWLSYAYHRPDYSDWKERHISVPLPPIVLPSISEKRRKLPDSFFLGSTVEVVYEAKITLPKGFQPVLPPNVNLDREFAMYTAHYSFEDGVLKGVRHLKTRLNEVAGSQRAAYAEFVESILTDEARTLLVVGSSAAGAASSNSAHSNNEEAQLLYGQAYESLQLGAPRAAITTLERVTTLDPGWSDGWLLLGQAQFMTGLYDKGIASFHRAVAADPSNLKALQVVARSLEKLNRDKEAIDAWQALLKVNPEEADAAEHFPDLLLKEHRYPETVAYLEKMAPERKDLPEIQVQLGSAYLGNGDTERALAHFHNAIEKDESAETLNNVAFALADQNRALEQAFAYATKAVKKTEDATATAEAGDALAQGLMPKLASVWDTMAWVRFQTGDLAAAEKYAQCAWALTQTPTIGTHLAQIYEKSGKKLQAAQTYAMVLAALPSFGDPALREKINARVKVLAAMGVKDTKNAVDELTALRTHQFTTGKPLPGGFKTANFQISFTNSQPQPTVEFRNGAEELRAVGPQLAAMKFPLSFPDDAPARITARGILSCSEVARSCTFVTYPASSPVISPSVAK